MITTLKRYILAVVFLMNKSFLNITDKLCFNSFYNWFTSVFIEKTTNASLKACIEIDSFFPTFTGHFQG